MDRIRWIQVSPEGCTRLVGRPTVAFRIYLERFLKQHNKHVTAWVITMCYRLWYMHTDTLCVWFCTKPVEEVMMTITHLLTTNKPIMFLIITSIILIKKSLRTRIVKKRVIHPDRVKYWWSPGEGHSSLRSESQLIRSYFRNNVIF